MKLNCKECADFLDDYLAGVLPPETLATFEVHLSKCKACRVFLDTYRKSVELGRCACQEPERARAQIPEELVRAILDSRKR